MKNLLYWSSTVRVPVDALLFPVSMIVVLGVGNSLHGDDGAGPAVAAGVAALGLPGIAAYDCGTAPENFTGVVRRAGPDLLVIVDAAEMGLQAGSVRWE